MLPADQLTLTDGRRITGSFLDGNASTIRFVTGDAIKTYAASDVVTIRLGEAPADPPITQAAGNVLAAGLSVTVKFLELIRTRRGQPEKMNFVAASNRAAVPSPTPRMPATSFAA